MSDSYHPVALGQFSRCTDYRGLCLRIVKYAPNRQLAAHAHESASVTLVIRGAFEEESAHGSIRVGAGDCVIKPPGARHANRFGNTETTTLQIEIPPAAPQAAPFGIAIRDYYCGPDRRLAPALFALLGSLRDGPLPKSDASFDNLLIDAMSAAAHNRRLTYTQPAWLTRVENEIRDSLPDVPRVAELADRVGVNPVHMARVFRRTFGCGVVEYIRRLRVQQAARVIGQDRPLIAAALSAGFSDQPHLNRAFRSHLGISPGHYRRLAETQLPMPGKGAKKPGA